MKRWIEEYIIGEASIFVWLSLVLQQPIAWVGIIIAIILYLAGDGK